MKVKLLGVLNIIIGIAQVIYLLLQNGTIRINAFIVNHRYTESFDNFMYSFMWILAVLILILLIFIIKYSIKLKKEGSKNVGNTLIIGGHIISLISFALMGTATILSPLCIIGGIILLKSN